MSKLNMTEEELRQLSINQVVSDLCRKVTRLEIIEKQGRVLVLTELKNVSVSFQDHSRTLKIFIKQKNVHN